MRGPTVNLLSYYLFYIFHLEKQFSYLTACLTFRKMVKQASSHIASIFQKYEMYLLPFFNAMHKKTDEQ